jgi:hypothetical protein
MTSFGVHQAMRSVLAAELAIEAANTMKAPKMLRALSGSRRDGNDACQKRWANPRMLVIPRILSDRLFRLFATPASPLAWAEYRAATRPSEGVTLPSITCGKNAICLFLPKMLHEIALVPTRSLFRLGQLV